MPHIDQPQKVTNWSTEDKEMHGQSKNSLSQEFQTKWYKNMLLKSIWKYQENTKENY